MFYHIATYLEILTRLNSLSMFFEREHCNHSDVQQRNRSYQVQASAASTILHRFNNVDSVSYEDWKLPMKPIENEQRFSERFPIYTLVSPREMKKIWYRTGVPTITLDSWESNAFSSCHPCSSTGSPLGSQKISLAHFLTTFHEHVKIDSTFIAKMDIVPIHRMKDAGTGFSAAALLFSRVMNNASKNFFMHWITFKRPPA